jgi:hypothetical protein
MPGRYGWKLRRTRAAFANNRAMPKQWYCWLEVQSVVRNKSQPPSRRHPASARHANLEAGAGRRPAVPNSRYSPPVHMIRLTKEREIMPYVWVHPDDEG